MKTIDKIILGGMVTTGLFLGGDAFFRENSRENSVKLLGGASLMFGAYAYSSYLSKRDSKYDDE